MQLIKAGRLTALAKAACLPLLILLIWAWATAGGMVPSYVLPSPWVVALTKTDFITGGGGQYYSGTYPVHFIESLKRVAGGFALGAVLGVPLGILLGYSSRLDAHIDPTNHRTR